MRPQEIRENLVTWYDMRGEKDPIATIETHNKTKLYKKLRKYFDKEGIELKALNMDGTVIIKVPAKWIKITPPRYVSDHLRQSASERRKRKIAEEKWNNLFRQRSNNADER